MKKKKIEDRKSEEEEEEGWHILYVVNSVNELVSEKELHPG